MSAANRGHVSTRSISPPPARNVGSSSPLAFNISMVRFNWRSFGHDVHQCLRRNGITVVPTANAVVPGKRSASPSLRRRRGGAAYSGLRALILEAGSWYESQRIVFGRSPLAAAGSSRRRRGVPHAAPTRPSWRTGPRRFCFPGAGLPSTSALVRTSPAHCAGRKTTFMTPSSLSRNFLYIRAHLPAWPGE